MLGSVALDGAVLRLGELFHHLDVGGLPVSDAPGIGTMGAGARQCGRDDDDLLRQAITFFGLASAAYTEDRRTP